MLLNLRKTAASLAAVIAAAALAVTAAALPAAAHDQLIDSSPLPDEQLAEAPAEVMLRFSDDVIEIGAEVSLQNGAGEFLEFPSALSISGDRVTQPLPELVDDAYVLNWRVVSQDGHPITGTIPFTVGDVTASDSTSAPGGEVDAPAGESFWTGTNVLIGAVILLVAAGAIVTFVMRMRRGNQPGQFGDSDKE